MILYIPNKIIYGHSIAKRYGETPLHLAARAGYSNVLKQLLEVGADYNVAGCNGTAYEIAINNNNQEMIAIFEGNFQYFLFIILETQQSTNNRKNETRR